MRTVDFICIDVEGFGSIQNPFHFDFHNPGINVIRGMNGTGKTTVFNALFWCLYGINLKGVTKDKVSTWPHVREERYRGTRVVVKYAVESGETYEVARHIAFKGKTGDYSGADTMMVFVDGELRSTGINDSTKLVEDSIGLNSKMFLNSVLFGQRMKKLIEADDEEKRKVFEELFNVEWVKQARERAVDKLNKVKAEVVELTNSLTVNEGKLNSYKEMILSMEQARDSFDEDNALKADEIQTSLVSLHYGLEEVVEELGGVDSLSDDGLHEKLLELEGAEEEISNAASSISDLNESIHTLTLSRASVEAENNSLQQRLYDYDTDKGLFTSSKEKTLKEYNESLERAKASLEEDIAKIKQIEGKLDTLRKSGVDLSVEDKINGITPRVNSLTLDVDRLTKQLNTLEEESIKKGKELDHYQGSLAENKCFNCGKPLDDSLSTEEAITAIQEELVTIKASQREVGEQKDRISKELGTITQERDNLTLLLPKVKDFKVLEVELQVTTHSKILTEERIAAGTLSIEVLENQVWDKTPPCTDADIQRRVDEVTRLQGVIDEQTQERDELIEENEEGVQKVDSLKEGIERYRSQLKEKERLLGEQQHILENISALEGNLEQLKVSPFPLFQQLEDTIALEKNMEKSIKELTLALDKKNVEVSHYALWVDAFGANGVKAFVFEAMLQLLNASMEVYAQQLGVRVRFAMNLDSSRKGIITQCYKDGGIVLYDELSGGEKQRVDIVQVFGTHDVVSGKVGFNILLMDEIFENLDSEGVDAVFELIRMKMTPDRSIYLITHLTEINTLFARVINFSKDGTNLTVS